MFRTGMVRLTSLALVAALIPVLFAQSGESTARRYAVVVGIDEYQAKQLGRLNYAQRDALGLAELLEQAEYQVVRLTSSSKDHLAPTHANITRELKRVLKMAQQGDVVVLAFAGHGLQFAGEADSYFCPSDARPLADDRENLLSLKDLYTQVANSFGTCVLLVDACRNDPQVRALNSARSGINSSAALPDGVAALFSCKAGEFAFENDQVQHGIFFHHTLERLRKALADGEEFTFNHLAEHVQERVPEDVQTKHRSRQTPVAKVNAGRVVLIPRRKFPATFTNSIGMEFVLVPGGEFIMGSPQGEADRADSEGPQRRVKVNRFYCGKFEVTRGQFAAFVKDTGYQTDQEKRSRYRIGDNEIYDGIGWNAEAGQFFHDAKYNWREPGYPVGNNHPVVLVSHNDAVTFVAWLNGKERRKGKYSLLREAEFEYANRAGSQKTFAHGDAAEDLATFGNVADAFWKRQFPDRQTIRAEDGHVFAAPVGQYRANAFGIHDMTGNVWEWCADWFDGQYYARGENDNPQGPATGDRRAVRGGCFDSGHWDCRASTRFGDPVLHRTCFNGFRICFRPE